jgi:hypothetical protein
MDILIIICLLGLGILLLSGAYKRNQYLKSISTSQVDEMNGIEFEHYVREILVHQGYSAKVTQGSNDYGVDIVAKKGKDRYAIQVKRYSGKVSRRAVSDSVGGMSFYNCNKSMVITNSYFTKGATELANSNSCILVDRSILSRWIYEFQGKKSEVYYPIEFPALDIKPKKNHQAASINGVSVNEFDSALETSEEIFEHLDDGIQIAKDEEIFLIAIKEYPHDHEMQEYEYMEQLASKNYMKEVKNCKLKALAQNEYPGDYVMQESEYRNQLSAKAFMDQVKDEELLRIARKEYPEDFIMQESEYKNQVSSRRYMEQAKDIEIARIESPCDFIIQESIYKEQIRAKKFIEMLPNSSRKQIVQRQYPGDYSMQEFEFNNS